MHPPAPNRTVTYGTGDFNEPRLRELIVYIAQKSALDPGFGVTKLNKILWWSDLRSFGQMGRTITGVTYLRLPQGPVPDGIDDLRNRMAVSGDIAISNQERFGRVQQRVVPLRSPDLSDFGGKEIAIVDAILYEHRGETAKGVSSRSHGRMWEALPQRAPMPYESVFISDAKPSRYDIARTRELNRQFGWE